MVSEKRIESPKGFAGFENLFTVGVVVHRFAVMVTVHDDHAILVDEREAHVRTFAKTFRRKLS